MLSSRFASSGEILVISDGSGWIATRVDALSRSCSGGRKENGIPSARPHATATATTGRSRRFVAMERAEHQRVIGRVARGGRSMKADVCRSYLLIEGSVNWGRRVETG